jgi:phosphatidylserine/phosphatidylglycerophosphate/cardiolipin synthase-like enzyme
MLSKGCVKVFLTDFTVKRKPDKQGNTLLCQELVRQINSAQSTIDIAIYGYDRVPVVEKALRNALKRGVKIRLVYDVDTKGENIYANTKELVGIIKNAVCDKAPKNYQNKAYYTNSLMHNKFYVFDRQTVITGSANLSATDMSGYNSNSVILIKSKKVAQVYETEFEQMYSSKFHALKHPVLNKENVVLGDMVVSIYFSPTDSAIEKVIVPLVNNAKKYIYMPVFLITDKRLAQALINAKSRGVDVKLIVDATNSKAAYSKHRLLRQHGIPVKTENYGGKLHSKSIMIDDKYTVIGSMNFSKSGEAKNDENLIVIKDEKITKFYKTFFCYLWNRIFNYWLTHDVSAESIYSIGSCSDGIDNDYDGLIDSADEGCKIKPKIKFK